MNINSLLRRFGKSISDQTDITGTAKPSFLFPFMARVGSRLLNEDPEKIVQRRKAHFLHFSSLIRWAAPRMMSFRQTIETPFPDLPNQPVIWCANHSFKDDVAATVGVARPSYIFFGSLPIFFNTFDGFGVWLNGTVLCNRKLSESRHRAFRFASKVLESGSDLILFPEGVWNKTPEKLLLHLWPGAVRLAQEQNVQLVPIVHYLSDPHKRYKGNVIHTAVGEPICVTGLSEAEGIRMLRDTMATLYYDLMDRYGHTTRSELLGSLSSDEAWEEYLKIHTGLKYYDETIEASADYRDKSIIMPAQVWKGIAEIEQYHGGNVNHVLYARSVMKQEQRRDFQRRHWR